MTTRPFDHDKAEQALLRRMAEPEPLRSLRLQKERIDHVKALVEEARKHAAAPHAGIGSWHTSQMLIRLADALSVAQETAGDWVMVPREPTEAMTLDGLECVKDGLTVNDDVKRTMRHAYRAMIAAAPSLAGRGDADPS